MASPSHCCVSSLVTSLTAWECALGQHSQLGRRTSLHQWLARNHVAVWYDVGLESLLSSFFFGGTYCTKKYKISGNFPGHLLLFLVENLGLLLSNGLMHIDSWKVFHPQTNSGECFEQ